MSGYAAKHRRTRIMYVAMDQLASKSSFRFCGCNITQWKFCPEPESGIGKFQFFVKCFLNIFIKCLTGYLFYDLTQKNKIIVAVDILTLWCQLTFKYPLIH